MCRRLPKQPSTSQKCKPKLKQIQKSKCDPQPKKLSTNQRLMNQGQLHLSETHLSASETHQESKRNFAYGEEEAKVSPRNS